jgi:protein-disulfide isomerase
LLYRHPTFSSTSNIPVRISERALNSLVVIMTVVAIGSVAYRMFTSRGPANIEMFGQREDWRKFASAGARVGNPTAKISITVFSDFQCPYCAKFAATAQEMLDRYPADVRMIFRHSPLSSLHAHAESAARAAICADAAGGFKAFHDVLFQKQDSLGKKSWGALARDAAINDTTALVLCMANDATTATLARDIDAAALLDLGGTPLILVNDVIIRRTPDRLQMDSIIRQQLGR